MADIMDEPRTTHVVTHRPQPCPWCQKMLGRAQRPDRPHQMGEASVCGACGKPLWYDTDGTIRALSPERMRLLPRSVQKGLFNTQKSVLARIERMQQQERERKAVRPRQPSHATKWTEDNE